ncbi:MAG: hypothetical protein ABSH13_21640, partial [Candidatus Acidiferrum sp.]
SFNTATICSSLNRLFRMSLLLSFYTRRSYALAGLNQWGKVSSYPGSVGHLNRKMIGKGTWMRVQNLPWQH